MPHLSVFNGEDVKREQAKAKLLSDATLTSTKTLALSSLQRAFFFQLILYLNYIILLLYFKTLNWAPKRFQWESKQISLSRMSADYLTNAAPYFPFSFYLFFFLFSYFLIFFILFLMFDHQLCSAARIRPRGLSWAALSFLPRLQLYRWRVALFGERKAHRCRQPRQQEGKIIS